MVDIELSHVGIPLWRSHWQWGWWRHTEPHGMEWLKTTYYSQSIQQIWNCYTGNQLLLPNSTHSFILLSSYDYVSLIKPSSKEVNKNFQRKNGFFRRTCSFSLDNERDDFRISIFNYYIAAYSSGDRHGFHLWHRQSLKNQVSKNFLAKLVGICNKYLR